MSDDVETLRQIAELARDDRPLLVLDVDEVLLEYVRPLMAFLDSRQMELQLRSFRLHGNIVDKLSKRVLENAEVTALLDTYHEAQGDWQTAGETAAEAVELLARNLQVILLTAMPHRYREVRRATLDRMGFPYPLVTTESAKGPALTHLRGPAPRPIAFVDDLPPNLLSASKAIPDIHLFHLTTMPALKSIMPALPENVVPLENWRTGAPVIAEVLRVPYPST